MLYNLLAPFAGDFLPFNLFRYLTFRTGGATMTALVLSFIIGPYVIAWLKNKQGEGQPIRADGPEGHHKKKGTPTMGGVMILGSVLVSTLLWCDLSNAYIWICLFMMTTFGAIGMVDDYMKLTRRSHMGFAGRYKFLLQLTLGITAAIGISMHSTPELQNMLALPFLKTALIPLGGAYIVLAALVIVGSSNAVNLTDGLDGLAIVPVAIAAACFGLITYLVGNAIYADYLQLHYIPKTGELAILCGALIGAAMGFLWFNAPPAMIFMGDTGSLSMGAVLGTMAVITKHELVLAIIGGVFVAETLSVILQVSSFKLTGRRIFAMAPLHHHFEKKGWSESTIVIRFWIIAVILALVGLSTLKLR